MDKPSELPAGAELFHLKQFSLWHGPGALKFNTDSGLLGSMAQFGPEVKRVADLGSGIGTLSFMLAQRYPDMQFTGYEANPSALAYARANLAISPFKDRIRFKEKNVKELIPGGDFDACIINPPFFVMQLKRDDGDLNMAMHTGQIDHMDAWLGAASNALNEKGEFWIIWPGQEGEVFSAMTQNTPYRRMAEYQIFDKPGARLLRRVQHYKSGYQGIPSVKELYLKHQNGLYTAEYKMLMNGYLLGLDL